MDFRDAASAERADILREGGQGRSGGAAGKKREAAGKPQAEPTFPESGGTGAFGQRNRERPPGELARRETGRDSKGSPGEKRTVGMPGSPGGKEPQTDNRRLAGKMSAGKSPACRMDAQTDGRRLAGKTFAGWSPVRRKDVRQAEAGLASWKSEGTVRSLLRSSRIGPCRSLLQQNSIGNRPGWKHPGRNLRRGRWRHRPRFVFGLKALRDRGLITDADYQAKKTQFLARLR